MKIDIRFTLLTVLFLLEFSCFSQSLPQVVIKTALEEIKVEVDTINAPVTGKNFLKHIALGTYKNGVFYRVVRMDNQPENDVKIEVIQGGVFVEPHFEKIESIKHETTKETGILHLNGTISMARMRPGSATTEFFICVNDQLSLDFKGMRNPDRQGFAAFGKVIKGMDVVRKIQSLKDKNQTLLEKQKFGVEIK